MVHEDSSFPVSGKAADPTTTLWFDKPASSFHQSLPLGNGRIGAMIFGGVGEERIVLNENSVWSGSREDADRPEAIGLCRKSDGCCWQVRMSKPRTW
jgi:alpha-L-fucosidase 2